MVLASCAAKCLEEFSTLRVQTAHDHDTDSANRRSHDSAQTCSSMNVISVLLDCKLDCNLTMFGVQASLVCQEVLCVGDATGKAHLCLQHAWRIV